ncbi:PilX N-terminal domain-containing pilus assembly protein [Planctomycetota bacterium]
MINSFNDPRSPIPDSQKGIVLLVVLGVLALLSVLAITFVKMTQLERNISRNYVDRTRAVLIAESGIEAAIARLGQFRGGVIGAEEFAQMQYNPDNPGAGLGEADKPSFMSSETGPGGVPISGAVSGTYGANGDYYLLKVQDESGKLNLNDSDALMDPTDNTTGRLLNIISNLAFILYAWDKGEDIGTVVATAIFTERDRLGGRFAMMSQVEDVLLELDFTTQECKKFLSNITLWSWQDPDVIKPVPAWGSYEDAKALYGNPSDDGFPKYGFPFMRWEEVQSFNDGDDGNGIHDYGYQLEPRCPVNVNTASRELIQALLMGLEGWSVMEGPSECYEKSTSLDGDTMCYYGAWTFFGLSGEKGVKFYSNYRYENTPRDATLLHNAANKIILDADGGNDFKTLTLPYARIRNIKIPDYSDNPSFSATLTSDLYDSIHGLGIYAGDPNPIENWREFKFYLDAVIQRCQGGSLTGLEIDDPFAADETEDTWSYDRRGDFQFFNEYYRDLILANFDPNTMSNDFNPDMVVYRHTDKADLVSYSTEFCFEPTGTFSIKSQGSVADGQQMDLKASAGVKAVVKLFEIKRLTNQAQLMGTDTSTSTMVDHLGINESASATKWGGIVGDDNGTRLISHPEPIIQDPQGQYQFEFVENGIFDGRIGLSPVKHNADLELDEVEGIDKFPCLWAYYEGTMNARNQGLENDGLVPPGLPSETHSYLKYQINNSYYDPILEDFDVAEELRQNENALMSPHSTDTVNRKPGTLFVDGVFSEAWKCPTYPLKANGESHLSLEEPIAYDLDRPMEGGHQTVLMSLKPGFMMKDSNRSRNFFNLGQGSCMEFPGKSNILAISRLQLAWDEICWYYPYLSSDQTRHSLIFGLGYGYSCKNAGEHVPRTNFSGTGLDLDRKYFAYDRTAFHFEGRRWNMIAVSWCFSAPIPSYLNRKMQVGLNGQQMTNPLQCTYGFGSANPTTLALPYTIIRECDYNTSSWDYKDITPADAPRPFLAPIRLGAFARSQGFSVNLHEPADSTYGEFIFYKNAIIKRPLFAHLDDFFWVDGFYYHDTGKPATYTTPEIDLGTRPGKPVTIRSISWTGRWPQYVMAADVNEDSMPDPVWETSEYSDYYQATVDADMPPWLEKMSPKDDPKTWDPFTVDILANDCWLYSGSESGCWNLPAPETRLSYSGGSVPFDDDGWKLKTDEPVRLKFYFNLAANQVEPLRESPYLDDVTITYIPAQGVKVLFYQMQ